MKTSDEYKRAQEIIDDADGPTADLIYEMWNELVRHEKSQANYQKIIEYWKLRAEVAEERISRAQLVANLDKGMTQGEKETKQRIMEALKSRIKDYDLPVLNPVTLLLAAIADKNVYLPRKIKRLIATLEPSDLIDELIRQGWYLNPKLTQESQIPVAVLESVRGTQVLIPTEKNSHYEALMSHALEKYSEEADP